MIGQNFITSLKLIMKEQVYDLQSVAKSSASERASFIRRTYAHLAVAILGFIAVEYYLVHSPFAAKLASSMTGGMSWLIVTWPLYGGQLHRQ